MKRAGISILILLVLFTLPVSSFAEEDSGELVDRPWESNAYSAIVFLSGGSPTSTFKNYLLGTGFFIDNAHILTAAHNLEDLEAEDIFIYPATTRIDGETVTPYNYAKVDKNDKGEFKLEKYSEYDKNDDKHDIAILALDRNLGKYTGTFEYVAEDWQDEPPVYFDYLLETAGYPNYPPEDYSRPSMWSYTGWTQDVDQYRHKFDMFTLEGHSGSPVWTRYMRDSNVVLSVLKGGNKYKGYGFGIRITEAKDEWIQGFINETDPPDDYPDLVPKGEIVAGDPSDFEPDTVTAGESTLGVELPIMNAGTKEATTAFDVEFWLSESYPPLRGFCP